MRLTLTQLPNQPEVTMQKITLGQIHDVMSAAEKLAPLDVNPDTMRSRMATATRSELIEIQQWVTALRRVAREWNSVEFTFPANDQ